MNDTGPECRDEQSAVSRRRFLKGSGLAVTGAATLGPIAACSGLPAAGRQSGGAAPLAVATFSVDATPPVNSPIAYVTATAIDHPLSARGVVLKPADAPPIVLAAVDWIGNYNGGYDAWRFALADAVGTSPSRVAMHALHQHNAPGLDFDADLILLSRGVRNARIDASFARATIRRAAEAAREALASSMPVTHAGVGMGRVKEFASNRQLVGDDGRILYVRHSSSASRPEMAAAPEGLIDPFVRVVSLWNEEHPLVSLSYYATHPQIYYRDGSVTWDTVGIARQMREEETGVFHVHFNGAGGNITAGKYNDGTVMNREILGRRLADGLALAWQAATPVPLEQGDISWSVRPVSLPPAGHLNESDLAEALDEDPTFGSASRLVWTHRSRSGHQIPVSRLSLGPADILHLPGELFVEYQLAAQQMRPDRFVALAAYGDGGPGYIGTRSAYAIGGYEVSAGASRVAPEAEDLLVEAMRDLLDIPEHRATKMPSDFTAEKIRISNPER